MMSRTGRLSETHGGRGAPARVVIVSDAAEWRHEAVRRCLALDGVAPEPVGWSRAGALETAPDALVVRADPNTGTFDPALFDHWAERAWQPLTVVWLVPGPGAAALSGRLDALRFRSVLWQDGTDEAWAELEARVAEAARSPLWLVPALAEALGVSDPRIVEGLAAAVARQPERLTIPEWSRAVGLIGYRDFERLLSSHGLPPPRRLLQWLRLLCVVDHAAAQHGSPTRERLARRFGYASGSYLGRRAKGLTGRPLGELVQAGPQETLRHLIGAGRENAPDAENHT